MISVSNIEIVCPHHMEDNTNGSLLSYHISDETERLCVSVDNFWVIVEFVNGIYTLKCSFLIDNLFIKSISI